MFYDEDYEDEIEEIEEEKTTAPKNNFLGIMFTCCNVYGRIYKNKDKTAYVGRCPRCMRTICVPIGQGGTNTRFFRAE